MKKPTRRGMEIAAAAGVASGLATSVLMRPELDSGVPKAIDIEETVDETVIVSAEQSNPSVDIATSDSAATQSARQDLEKILNSTPYEDPHESSERKYGTVEAQAARAELALALKYIDLTLLEAASTWADENNSYFNDQMLYEYNDARERYDQLTKALDVRVEDGAMLISAGNGEASFNIAFKATVDVDSNEPGLLMTREFAGSEGSEEVFVPLHEIDAGDDIGSAIQQSIQKNVEQAASYAVQLDVSNP